MPNYANVQTINQSKSLPSFRVVMTSLDGINRRSIQTVLRGENDSKQSDEIQASRIQTYRIFYFLRRLFAKHQTLSSQCWIFSSRSRSHKIRLLSISKFFVHCCHGNTDFTKTYILANFNLQSIIGENFIAIRQV